MFSFRASMRVGVAAVVSLGVGLVLASSSPAQADVAAPTGWVTGVVLDGNGDPVEGALVDAIRPSEVPEAGILAETTDRRTWTEPNGTFQVRQAAAGYLVQICDPEPSDNRVCRETAQGVDHLITYVGPAGVTDSWVPQTTLFEATATDRDLGAVTVKPQSFIHGRLQGAKFQLVQLLRLDDTVAYRAQTDGEGDYRFQGLAPGSYRVSGGGNGFLPWRSAIVTVEADADAEVNGRVRRGARIDGVLKSGGHPVPFTDVLVRKAGGELVAAATTNRRGVYHVSGLVPADYRLGILYDGSDYQRKAVTVTVPDADSSVTKDIRVRKGAVIEASVVRGAKPVSRMRDELRDESGRPILGLSNDGHGHVRYAGLSDGTYTLVAATESRYAKKRIVVRGSKTYDLGTVRLDHATFSLSGTTAPNAVVEAMTGDQCLPDGPDESVRSTSSTGRTRQATTSYPGWFRGGGCWARTAGRSTTCLAASPMSGSLTTQFATCRCRLAAQCRVGSSMRRPGLRPSRRCHTSSLSVRLVGRNRPTSIPRGRSRRLRPACSSSTPSGPATSTGQLSPGASDDEQINNEEFFVIFPVQDGTPYYLTSDALSIEVGPGIDLDLGDIDLTLHGAE